MRIVSISLSGISLFCICIAAQAQAPQLDVEAGLGYARVFDGGGFSFSAAVDRSLGSALAPVHQGVGLSLWYAQTKIASEPADFRRRNLVGIGLRYRAGLQRCCGAFRPFVSVPLQLLRSSIEDVTQLVAELTTSGVPEPPPEPPVEDLPGGAWGWGTGLELGLELGLARNLAGQTRVQGLYQDIYDGATSNTAWAWHTGLRYAF